jgi:hypothetical protein
MTTETQLAQSMLDDMNRRNIERLFGVTACAAEAPSSITLKDLRDSVLKIPHFPKLSWVRVSDDWWVSMEDGKPTGTAPHSQFMQVIEDYCKIDAQSKTQTQCTPH